MQRGTLQLRFDEPNNLAIQVTAGSRIHISLADMGLASPRSYGGVGFMIDRVAARVKVMQTDRTMVDGNASLDPEAQRELADLLLSLVNNSRTSVGITVEEHAPQHVGLGTKTALKLSIIAGFDELIGSHRDRLQQQIMSGRGGASGIGVHGFYEGGVLWDAGRPRNRGAGLLPSSRLRKNPRTIQFSLRFRMPERLEMPTRGVNSGNLLSNPAKIMSQGWFWTDSGCHYAAAPNSFGSRIRS